MMWEICRSNHDSSMSTSAIKTSRHSGRSCNTSPFSSSKSWPNCPRCSLAFPPRWKPGRWGTFPDRAHREDHSWWENKHTVHRYWHVCFIHPQQTKNILELNSLLQSLPQVFEPPLWWDQLLQLVNQCFCLKKERLFWITVNTEHLRNHDPNRSSVVLRTCLDTLSQVFLRRNTELRLREEVISRTAL